MNRAFNILYPNFIYKAKRIPPSLTSFKDNSSNMLLIFFILWHGISLSAAKQCHPDDRAALTAFKRSFSNPVPFPSWTPLSDCCDWYGVRCDLTTGHVVGVDIPSYEGINGTIPSSISDLKYLQVLRLHRMPNLFGQIPKSIAKLSNLQFLIITRTNISGPIPGLLSRLTNLSVLDLSFNRLTGSIPASLTNLPSIRTIDLSRNQLTGPIPELFTRTAELPYLVLSHNNLSGHLPPSFSKVNFSTVDISRNGLSGDASVLFGKGKITYSITISRNNFEFDFSKVALEGLSDLDISHNRIYGTIPEQITENHNWQSLNVSYNRLCGKIPTGWQFPWYRRDFKWDNTSFIHNKCLCGIPLDPCK